MVTLEVLTHKYDFGKNSSKTIVLIRTMMTFQLNGYGDQDKNTCPSVHVSEMIQIQINTNEKTSCRVKQICNSQWLD